MQREREAAAANEQALKEEWKLDADKLTDSVEKLKAQLQQKEAQRERASSDWFLERRQLEAKLEKSEDTCRSLQKSISELQTLEENLHGKEAKVVFIPPELTYPPINTCAVDPPSIP